MYKKRYKGWLKHLDFIVIDLISIQLSFVLAYMIRFGALSPYKNSEYLSLAIVYLLVDFFVAVVFNSFKNVLKRGAYKEFGCVVKHSLLVEGITLFYLFSIQTSDVYSRISFYIMLPIYIGITYLLRILWKQKLKKSGLHDSKRALLIVAPEERLKECVESVVSINYNTYSSIGAVAMDASMKGKKIAGVLVVTDYDELTDYVQREWVDEVFILPQSLDEYPAELAGLLNQMGVTVHIAIARRDNMKESRQQVEKIGGYIAITTSLNYATPAQLFLKRLMDIAGGLVGCLITLIILVIFGPMIYLSSPGPVFFAQTRVGRNGRKFKMYKFRTMYMDAEERKKELMAQNKIGDGMMFKMDFDPRIIGNQVLPDGSKKTGIGQFMRRTSLDEFPQMFNVLRGDMSLVGTRPPTLDEWEKYEPHHRARLSFRPGLTGLWQVSGRSNITDFEEVVKLDTEYIDQWSLGLDIKIVAKTAISMFKDEGAM